MKGGAVVVDVLSELGCRFVFGIPGVHNLEIYDALFQRRGVTHVLVKHESNGAIMADVYGRLTGEPGVCVTTAGPGATNCVTALAQAYGAASPVIHVAPTVPVKAAWETLHGVDDDNFLHNVFRSVTKWAVRVEGVNDLASTLAKAYGISTTGRMGPVHVSIPTNILMSQVDSPLPPLVKSGRWREVGEISDGVIQRLRVAERPVVYVGKNVSRYGCEGELLELCDILGAPVVVDRRNALSVVPHDSKLYAGFVDPFRFSHPAGRYAIDSADLVLSIGARLGATESEPLKKPHQRGCIHIDVEEGAGRANYAVDTVIVGNIKETLKLLVSKLKSVPRRTPNVRLFEEISRLRREVSEAIDSEVEANQSRRPIHPGVVVRTVRSILERDAVVTNDVGNAGFWLRETYDVLNANGLIEPGVYDSMGFALPAAICAKLVHPKRQVLAVTGDGALLMSYAELPTVLENGLNLIILVFNDSKYSAIWHMQRHQYAGRFIGSDLRFIDFAAIFRAMGGNGIRVEDPRSLKVALEGALSSKSATLIDVMADFSVENMADRIYPSSRASVR